MADKKTDHMEKIISICKNKKNFSEIQVESFAPDGKWASQVAEYLGKETKINQLRKTFGEIRRMEFSTKGKKQEEEFKDRSRLFLLIPQLAYAKARGLIQDKFYDLMKTIIGDGDTTKIRTVGDYQTFVKFVTAIVAYHKRYAK